VEEGERNLSPRMIEPPQNQTTIYDENVREWRKKYWATQVDREEPGPAEIVNREIAGLEALEKINTNLRKKNLLRL